MKKLKIEFDFDNCEVCLYADDKRTDKLTDRERLKYLGDITKSIAAINNSNIEKTINLVLAQETMLQFTSSASFADTRCYEMQVKITDMLRNLKAKQTMNKLFKK